MLALVACQHCLASWHVIPLLMVNMSQNCLKGRHILRSICFTVRLSYWRTLLIGELVLWEFMCFMRTCLIREHVVWDDISYRKTCLAVGHVIHEDMSYRKTCISGKHVLYKDILQDRHVLWEDIPYG